MNHLNWISNTSIFDEVQEQLENDVQLLLDAYFVDVDNYAIEKFVKFYAEGLRYFEKTLLLQRGVDPNNYSYDLMLQPQKILELQDEVKRIMLNELKRHYRHATTFIPALLIKSKG